MCPDTRLQKAARPHYRTPHARHPAGPLVPENTPCNRDALSGARPACNWLQNLQVARYTTYTTTPSVPANLATSTITQTTAILGWSASTDNVGVTGYEISIDNGAAISVTTTTYNASGFTAGTTHNFKVLAKDATGNKSAYSSPKSFTTITAPDTTAPSVPAGLMASNLMQTSATLSWTASTDNVGVSGYVVYRGGTQVATVSGTTYSDTGLQSATAYTYTIKALDAAGNASVNSAPVTVSTLSAPLSITSSGVSTKLATSATITWMTNIQSSGTVYYGTSKTALTKSVTDGVVGTSHAAAITGLTKNTTYYYKVTATTADGQTVDSVVGTFKTRVK